MQQPRFAPKGLFGWWPDGTAYFFGFFFPERQIEKKIKKHFHGAWIHDKAL